VLVHPRTHVRLVARALQVEMCYLSLRSRLTARITLRDAPDSISVLRSYGTVRPALYASRISRFISRLILAGVRVGMGSLKGLPMGQDGTPHSTM
jgi:hypothetical protein